MMNATLKEKPYAGNPHVRIDGGKVASYPPTAGRPEGVAMRGAEPRRGSLIYGTIRRMILVALAITGVWRAEASTVGETDTCGFHELATRVAMDPLALDLAVKCGDEVVKPKSVAVTGLPSGLKYKDGVISGTPVKSGVYVATVTLTTTLTFGVRSEGENVVLTSCDAAMGKVQGQGVYADGKNVTLTATANRGYAFAGWRSTTSAASGGQPTFTFAMPAEDVAVEAVFVTVEEDRAAIQASVDGIVLSADGNGTNVLAGVALAWPVIATALTDASVSVTGLPDGLKFTSKDVIDGKTGALIAQANTIYGTPTVATKPGQPKKVKVIVTTAGKTKREFVLPVAVSDLPSWAVGSFNGGSSSGQVSLTIAKTGKMSGKWLTGGKTWTLSATGYDASVGELGSGLETLFATLQSTCGKETKAMRICVTSSGLTGYDGPNVLFSADSFDWKSGDLKALSAKIAKAPALVCDVAGEQPGTMTLSFGSGGKVMVSGQFKDGETGGQIKVSGSAVLCPAGEDNDGNPLFDVYVYLPAKGAFKGYSEVLNLTWEGTAFSCTGRGEDEASVWNQLFEAYTYAYPLVMVGLTKTVSTNVEEPIDGRAPVNQLAHKRDVADASYRDIVTPSCDTVYTQAWMDLSEEPVIYVVPEADRFFESQLMSGWTDTFIAISEPGTYAIARKDWKGELPEGVTRVDSPTSIAWLLARVLLNGKEDLENVEAIQAKMRMLPLSDYLKGDYVAPKGTHDPKNDFVPAEKILEMTPQEFFDAANRLMVDNPPAEADSNLLSRIKALNVGPGLKFDASKLPGNVNENWNKMINSAQPVWLADSMRFVQMNGIWMFFGEPLGDFGTEYDYRALTAHDGIGANTVDVAIYPKAETDSDGQVLTGENTYIMHFDSLPPIHDGGFWSVTAYDEDFYLIDNPIDRYAINDRTDFKLNADGSLDIVLSAKRPADTSNWLPVCSGVFQLFMRLYVPDLDAFSAWPAPTIKRVDEASVSLLQKAFDYTLPLVMVELSKRNGTNVEADNGTGYAPLNQLGHCKFLLDASFKGVVTPNVDTLYSNAYMDIGKEPMVLVMPEADRYMAAQVMDGWTRNVALIKRAGVYAFVKKGYKGEIPKGVEVIELETSNVWLIIRTLCNGKDDLDNIYKLQGETSLVPLSVYASGKMEEYVPPKGTVNPENEYVPVDYALGLSLKDYFDMANGLMGENPPAEADAAVLKEISAINVGPGCTFDPAQVDESAWAYVHCEVSGRYDDVMSANSVSLGQWGYLDDPIGSWEGAYDYRAAIALKAIGANSLKAAVYATTYSDADGRVLDGNRTYVMHFDSMPPIGEGGFWSVTAYGNDDFLIDNPIDRYCINDRTDFQLNQDGSLDIVISNKQPSSISNWLPVSDQGFHLYLRMYEPQLDKLPSWSAPVITVKAVD